MRAAQFESSFSFRNSLDYCKHAFKTTKQCVFFKKNLIDKFVKKSNKVVIQF